MTIESKISETTIDTVRAERASASKQGKLRTAGIYIGSAVGALAFTSGLITILKTATPNEQGPDGVILSSGLCVQNGTQGYGDTTTYVVDTKGPTGEYNLRAVGFMSKPQAIMSRMSDGDNHQHPVREIAVSAPENSRLHTYTQRSFDSLATEATYARAAGATRINCLSRH